MPLWRPMRRPRQKWIPPPKDRWFSALIGAANHDPAVFPDPDRFIVDRPGAENHLSFGGGIHFCLGRRIGLQSGMLALSSLLRRFPDLKLAGAPAWRKTIPTRRLDRLEVTTT